jgi:methylenetetrahydrofolate dehydrogenase(NAD+)/5,10-methenyltetrahydrofolate cyclohydrolase
MCPQLPLPEHITERAVCNAVAPHKDVDGFNIVNVGRFCLDMNTLVPCTPLGVVELIKRTGNVNKMKLMKQLLILNIYRH